MTRTHESHVHTSAVCRSEAAIRRASPLAFQREFAAVLDQWADAAELRAVKAASGGQPDLFSTPPAQEAA
jgi:hypothetical protein